MWKKFVSLISGEWILNNSDNGGSVIVLRSLICSAILFFLVIGLANMVDPAKSWQFSIRELQLEIKSKIAWFGALFAAVYVALYGRFASQWAYLANLYNSIKAASLASDVDAERLAEWKAGFIEDAEYLHLSHKENFASVIHTWGQDEEVKKKYVLYTPGGEVRFNKLMESVSKRYENICKEHEEP